MPAETIVSELLKIIQHEVAESGAEDLCAKEQKALKIGRLAAQMSLSEMLSIDEEEPVVVGCSCGDVARSKEREVRMDHLRRSSV